MPKIDKDGREYIEQDGKRYYKNFWGEWEAEKDWLGNDKVNTDWLGNPKIETDWLGRQKIETDWLGRPYVEPEKKEDQNCFLTTACMQSLSTNFHDDCYELSTLRKFRDSYLQENYPEEIEEYYKIAPSVVENILKMPNKKEVFSDIYTSLVSPAVSLIEKGEFKKAYLLYKDYTLQLQAKYS